MGFKAFYNLAIHPDTLSTTEDTPTPVWEDSTGSNTSNFDTFAYIKISLTKW